MSWLLAPEGPARLNELLDGWLGRFGHKVIRLRRHLHSHPELSGAEFATTRLLARCLRVAGLEPSLLPKQNGLICDVAPERPLTADTVAIRADIDALPIADLKEVPYRSRVPGVSHACGHDVHASSLVAAGAFLASLRDVLPGRVRLLLQPAEEILPCGSLEVIAAGGLAGVSEIFAVHCDPRLPAGQVGLRVGPITAAADNVAIMVSDRESHNGSRSGNDVIDAVGRLVTDLPAMITRRTDTRGGMLVVFGQVEAGADEQRQSGRVSGTVRVLDRTLWGSAPDLITTLVQDILAPTGVGSTVDYNRGRPPVVNDSGAVQSLSRATIAALGPEAPAETPQSMGGEDFSWYLEHVPGALARLGVARPGEFADIHQGTFDVDERAVHAAVRLFVHTAVDALAKRVRQA